MGLRNRNRIFAAFAAVTLASTLAGCAGSITQWLVNLRTSQGDSALAQSSLLEAEKEYGLALKLDPHDTQARSGLARVLLLQARQNFANSRLDLAGDAINLALKYAPDDVPTQALAAQIGQAKIRREIVLANYPLYASVGTSLNDSMRSLTATQRDVAKQLKAFDNDFDTTHLTRAIEEAYDLEDGAHRLTSRIVGYRDLVSSGAPKSGAPSQSEVPNLLPVP